MTGSSVKSFPIPSVQRLPVYLRFLKEQRQRGEIVVSCTRIAEEFGQLSVQVRKDLAITGISGRPKVGYRVIELIDAIEEFLGWNVKTDAYLVGAGSLGSAILGYDGFVEHGLNIVAAFDSSPHKVGQIIHHCPVHAVKSMLEMGKARQAPVEIGIVTVPAGVAQEIANQLVDLGVRAIWNYTPTRLDLPDEIVCEDVKLSASFAVLSSRLKKRSVFPDEEV
ncbi:MAG TPA: redox-sensing transcriptional repressor Rex [Planctomycetaceae bacterium]|nr:redox-sensing transcriptional repressor Rex [Planctomycetaceae bacterium]